MLQRLPLYLNHLKSLPENGASNISATAIAEALGFNDVVVRKDLACASDGGKPRIGYGTQALIRDLERVLGCNDVNDAILVGVGSLGHALMSYNGFAEYGLNIVAGFDSGSRAPGAQISGRRVFSADKLPNLCERMKIRIGIICVPAREAQGVCDLLVGSGVLAIWNFAPVRLRVPEGILVRNENMAVSLAMLSRHLTEKLSV